MVWGPFMETVTRRRFTAGAGVDPATGRPEAQTFVDEPVRAHVQPPTGEDLQQLEGWDRETDVIKLYTRPNNLFRGTNQHDDIIGDHVIVDGIEYRIRVVRPRRRIIRQQRVFGIRLREAG